MCRVPQAFPLLKAAWDMGVTTWDTANMYRCVCLATYWIPILTTFESNGESESIIGKFIKQVSLRPITMPIMTTMLMVISTIFQGTTSLSSQRFASLSITKSHPPLLASSVQNSKTIATMSTTAVFRARQYSTRLKTLCRDWVLPLSTFWWFTSLIRRPQWKRRCWLSTISSRLEKFATLELPTFALGNSLRWIT